MMVMIRSGMMDVGEGVNIVIENPDVIRQN